MDQPQTPDRPDPLRQPGNGTGPRDNEGAGRILPESPDDAAPPPPLTPVGWLLSNGPYLILFLVGIGWLYNSFGFDGLWRAALVVVGLSFLIFIHELGHFLAAKWCDVHVNTFSLGFGPALPGCSFQRGETTYKIGVLPLGGYVSMVGEGLENEEEDDYPRSFKNKTVGQRMLIISAGVVMNVIVGAICFVVVYLFHGVERHSAVVWGVEPGSPAWKKGVRTGSDIVRIASVSNPYFEDLRMEVALSGEGDEIPFEFVPRQGDPLKVSIEPRRNYDDLVPVIGVSSIRSLELYPARAGKLRATPTAYSSPAAAARVTDLMPGDVVVQATDPEGKLGKLDHSLADRTFDLATLSSWMRQLGDRPMTLKVIRADAAPDSAPTDAVLEPRGFDFGDRIIGTSVLTADGPYRPLAVEALPQDPNNNKSSDARDPYIYYQRLRALVGKPVVLEARRAGGETVRLLVPPAYHHTFGMRMKMGEVAAIRDGSPASKVGLVPSGPGTTGDVITRAVLTYPDGSRVEVPVTSPERLPFELRQAASARSADGKSPTVTLTVLRPNPDSHKAAEEHTLKPMEWDASWDEQVDIPQSPSAPMAIPQLGIAYWVESTVVAVTPGSPAARAGIQRDDRIEQIALRSAGKTVGEGKWGSFQEMQSERFQGQNSYDQWAHYFWVIQGADYQSIKVYVRRGGKLLDEPLELTAEPDTSWPRVRRGLLFDADTRLQKASSLVEALGYGVDKTGTFIKTIYLNLRSLIVGRISSRTLGGPIEIAAQSFAAAEDPWVLILWLGLMSVNLAVVNFLPIPVLDGGHMVFLVYEKLRGRPPSEAVRAVATYIGLAIICSLMLFVFYLDIKRRILGL